MKTGRTAGTTCSASSCTAYPRKEGEGLTLESVVDRLGIPKEEPFHNALDDALYTARVCRKLPLAEGLATYPTEEELLTEALLGAENTGRDVKLFMNRMEHDDYRSVPELYQAGCLSAAHRCKRRGLAQARQHGLLYQTQPAPTAGTGTLRFKLSRRARPALELCPLHRPGYPGVRCQMG